MSKPSRKITAVLTAAVLLGLAGATATIAQNNLSAAPADIIKTRQQGLKELGAAVKLVRDQLQTGNPDADKIKGAAANVKKAADAIATWFPQGSGPEVGVKTAAKPEIWSDAENFNAARSRFVEQVGKFVQVADSGDAVAIGAGVKALGQTCSGCHDKFRVKEG